MSKVKVHLNGQIHEIVLEENETLLEAMMRFNLDAPYACMAAACTQCKATLLSGEVEMDDTGPLTEEEIDQGAILTCQSRAINNSSLEIEFQDE